MLTRNLVVCGDGTGNIWGNDCDTNVVKLARLLSKTESQILFYDPGVGTSDTYPSIGAISRAKARGKEIWALAIGGGIYENIGQAYSFLVEHYQPNDRIFIFGFSRGAFTARCVAGMINLFGIVRRGTEAMIPTLTRIYFQPIKGTRGTGQTRKEYGDDIRDVFTLKGHNARVYFLGVWDTVSTVGGLPGSKQNITSSKTVKGKNYDHVRHAVSAHEYRYSYAPRLFTDVNFDTGGTSLKQLRFAGAHSDIGGSYREEGLSNCSLKWMLEEAIQKGLRCDQDKVASIQPDPLGLAHDQVFRRPLWALAGLRTRLRVLDLEPHSSFTIREEATQTVQRPKTDWKAPLNNFRMMGWIGAMLGMFALVHWLSNWACLYPCSEALSEEFNLALFHNFLHGSSLEDVLRAVIPDRMIMRYLADFLFIITYTGAACWFLIYARRIVAELTTSANLHRAAHWTSLISLWTLIGSDTIENVLTICLLHETVWTYKGYATLPLLIVVSTCIKMLSVLVLSTYLLLMGGLALGVKRGVDAE